MSGGEWSLVVLLQVVFSLLAALIGKVWSERLARNEQAKLDERLSRLESSLEAATHVTRARYDHEFEIYKELWQRLLLATAVHSAHQLGALKASPDTNKTVDEIVQESISKLGETLQANRPFYSVDVHNAAKPIYDELSKAQWWRLTQQHFGISFENDDDRKTTFLDNVAPSLLQHSEAICDAIRHRMETISTV